MPGSKIFLFGSYAKGSFKEDSDIDIAVFLPVKYKKHSPVIIFRQICKLTGKYDFDIQPQIFFEDEFENPAGIIEEVIEYGFDISEHGH